ncbi:MAG TPA: hypothetical protein VF533_10985 [Solirubrobacteraceae bacterium]|jgi:hypothetical protein
MKSRLAILAMLVAGLLMSGTGAGLAISGVSGSGDASIAQYGCDADGDGDIDATEDLNGDAPGCDDGGTLPTTSTGGSNCDVDGDGVISPSEAAAEGCGGVKGDVDQGGAPDDTPTAREEAAQPTRQTEAGGNDELPFTGFAAVPILIGGIALMAGGLVLRRRTAAE